MRDAESTHHYIQEQLDLHGYFGQNLDALYDVLSVYDKEICIILTNEPLMHAFLFGNSAQQLIQTFQYIDKINENIQFNVL